MMILIFFLDILQYLKCLFSSSRLYYYFLKTAFQCPVFFYILPVFIKGSGSDTLDFTTCQSRFQHIGGIHRSCRRSGSHNSMNFINEKNYIRILLQFIDNRANTFFKLSTVFGSGHYRSHIKHYNSLVKQDAGDLFLYNAQRKSFHYCRLADTRFTNQHRIILLTTAQNLRQTLNFPLAAYYRIKLAFSCRTSHIHTKIIQYRSIIGRLLCCRSRRGFCTRIT